MTYLSHVMKNSKLFMPHDFSVATKYIMWNEVCILLPHQFEEICLSILFFYRGRLYTLWYYKKQFAKIYVVG